MAYYFAVETEENSFVAKNIRYSKFFGAENYNAVPYKCSLEEIDGFTTSFKDETELKEQLLKEGIIKENDLDKNIAIIFTRGIERRKVGGNILYNDSRLMIEQPTNTINYIKKQAYEKNFHFFRELSKKLPNGTINKSVVSKLASLIEATISSKETELDDKMIDEVAKLLIYRSQIKENGNIVSEKNVNTENLHNVLSFISEYEGTLTKTNDYTKTLKNTSN